MASPAPALKGVLSPVKWVSDETVKQCRQCKEEFTTFNRRHHCRGCGQLYCANCTTMSPLGQYGFTSAVMACLRCAAPYIAKGEPYVIPTAGAEIAFTVYNAGADLTDLRMEFDGVPLELKNTTLALARDGGVILKASVPPGRGTKHSIILRRLQRNATGKARISYAKPKLSRTSALKTEGGELTLFGDQFGESVDAIRVVIDGVAIPASDLMLKQPHTKLRVMAPPGSGVSRLRIEVGDQSDEMDVMHAAPELTGLEPPDVDLAGGTVALLGRNFGDNAAKVQVILPDLDLSASGVVIVEPHVRIECVLPPLPASSSFKPGDEVRVRVVVDGIHSLTTASVVYCPPYGVPASAGKAAYFPKRPVAGPAAALGAAASATPSKGTAATPSMLSSPASLRASASAGPNAFSPYADLFSTTLSVEAAAAARRRAGTERQSLGANGAASAASHFDADGGGLGSPSAGDNSGDVMARSRLAAVRVGGTLAGGGPTLAITPPKHWAPDSPSCDICSGEFGLTRRRHHCRICGCCVCSSCSPHSLQLATTKPAVRVCTRCHLRVGLLNQMTSVVDSIYNIRKVLPSTMYETFKAEVMEAVLAPLAAGSGAAAVAGRQLSSPRVAEANGAVATLASAASAAGQAGQSPLTPK